MPETHNTPRSADQIADHIGAPTTDFSNVAAPMPLQTLGCPTQKLGTKVRLAASLNAILAMRCVMGEDLIADLDEDVRMTDAAPIYEDADGVTAAYLTIATKADHLARQLKGIR